MFLLDLCLHLLDSLDGSLEFLVVVGGPADGLDEGLGEGDVGGFTLAGELPAEGVFE